MIDHQYNDMENENLYEFMLLSKISAYHVKIAVTNIIHELIELRITSSGSDSLLKNTWEEYCVQLQEEESFDFEAYQITVNEFVRTEVDKLPASILELLAFVEQGEISPENEFAACAIQAILDQVNSAAMNYTNSNIQNYLKREEDDKEDDEEDENTN